MTEMTELQHLQHALDVIRVEQAKLAAKLGDLSAERFQIENDVAEHAAALAAAETALVEALADAELGRVADVDGARQRLADARLMTQNGIESSQRLSVLSALRQRMEADHTALHEKGLGIMAAIREAEKDSLVIMANELFNDCETALERLAQAEPKLLAVRSLLSEYGHSWHLGQLVQAQVQARFPITPNQARASVLADLNA